MDEFESLISDFTEYSHYNLKIKTKTGSIEPLVLNRAQIYLNKRIEEQKKRLGYVRIVVIKGRQQGISTYIGARFYWLTTTSLGTNTFIFAHDTSGTQSLFKMVNRYYEFSDEFLQPKLGASNKNELSFNELDSGYRVGTAGSSGLGRSQTNQLLHWSEVAWSPNPEEHSTGVLQTVPTVKDTEIILESTANANGDYFHLMVLEGLSGESDWETVFLPWYWQDEYKRTIDDNFILTKEEEELYSLYSSDGLTKEHLCWRRYKIRDFKGDVDKFKKEYPFNIDEAFEISDDEAYIKASIVEKAFKTPVILSNVGSKIWGVDPSRLGGDEFRVTERIGRNVTRVFKIPAGRIDQTSSLLLQEINKHKPDVVNIDVGGLGVGVYDTLYANDELKPIVKAINSSHAADKSDEYFNKRNEMYGRALEWLLNEPCSLALLDEKTYLKLKSQLSSAKKGWDNNQRVKIESKEDIKKRLKRSPDDADSFVLTFATIVPDAETLRNQRNDFDIQTNWIT